MNFRPKKSRTDTKLDSPFLFHDISPKGDTGLKKRGILWRISLKKNNAQKCNRKEFFWGGYRHIQCTGYNIKEFFGFLSPLRVEMCLGMFANAPRSGNLQNSTEPVVRCNGLNITVNKLTQNKLLMSSCEYNRVMRTVTLSSPCLWASFHPLAQAS